jgi:hypothetical protein
MRGLDPRIHAAYLALCLLSDGKIVRNAFPDEGLAP